MFSWSTSPSNLSPAWFITMAVIVLFLGFLLIYCCQSRLLSVFRSCQKFGHNDCTPQLIVTTPQPSVENITLSTVDSVFPTDSIVPKQFTFGHN